MSHDHHHHRHGGSVSRRLMIATVATGLFVVIEAIVGFRSNSLALVGDALHNFTDALALVLALAAVRFERRPPTMSKSYGYHRAGVLAAFINAGTLAAFTIYIFVEAFQRLRVPEAVNSLAMLVTAAISLLVNGTHTRSLHPQGKDELNKPTPLPHMLGGAMFSA